MQIFDKLFYRRNSEAVVTLAFGALQDNLVSVQNKSGPCSWLSTAGHSLLQELDMCLRVLQSAQQGDAAAGAPLGRDAPRDLRPPCISLLPPMHERRHLGPLQHAVLVWSYPHGGNNNQETEAELRGAAAWLASLTCETKPEHKTCFLPACLSGQVLKTLDFALADQWVCVCAHV